MSTCKQSFKMETPTLLELSEAKIEELKDNLTKNTTLYWSCCYQGLEKTETRKFTPV